MKKKEIQELKSKTPEELVRELHHAREELRKQKFDLYAGKVKNVALIRDLKKRIARVLTFLHIQKS